MSALPLKVSRKAAMSSVLLFVFGGQKDLAQMPFSLKCYRGNKCFTRQAIHVSCKSLLMVEKVLLMRNDLVAMYLI